MLLLLLCRLVAALLALIWYGAVAPDVVAALKDARNEPGSTSWEEIKANLGL